MGVQPSIGAGMFWRLLVGTIVMLAAGYCGEAGFMNPFAGFFVGLGGWGFILYEIFSGEAGSVAASGDKVSENVKTSFATMRFIVTVGWSIYPLGYFFGYLMGSVNDDALNLVYNLADFINKIAFCLAIWASAKKDTHEKDLKQQEITGLDERSQSHRAEAARLLKQAESLRRAAEQGQGSV